MARLMLLARVNEQTSKFALTGPRCHLGNWVLVATPDFGDPKRTQRGPERGPKEEKPRTLPLNAVHVEINLERSIRSIRLTKSRVLWHDSQTPEKRPGKSQASIITNLTKNGSL